MKDRKNKIKRRDSEVPLEWYEKFFIENIQNGLKLKGEKLTKEEEKILKINLACQNKDLAAKISATRIIGIQDSEDLAVKITKTLETVFQNTYIDKHKWNDKMINVLNDAFNNDVKEYPSTKKFGQEIGFGIRHPKIRWNEAFEDLYKYSDRIVLTGVVQNWYFKYGKKKISSCLSLTCLIPISLIFLSIFI